MDLTLLRDVLAGPAALAALPGTVELGILTAASVLPARKRSAGRVNRPVRIAVTIPAHNERENIGQCLDSLIADNEAGAEIVVIADNCTDETAAIARQRGVEVLERFSDDRRGKGFALEYAFEQLARRKFDAYIIVDADSVVQRGFLAAFARAFAQGADAAQCAYLALNANTNHRTRLLDIALRGFNLTRPQGRARLGLSAGILGNGFGLRRETLERVPYTAHSVVEDLEYHLALVAAGYRVEFVEATTVYGAMPAEGKGRETQRARWEGGRLRMLREHGLPLAGTIFRGRVRAIEPLLDLLLLPLGFHAILLIAGLCGTQPWLRESALFGLATLLLHVLAATSRGSAPMKDLRALATAPAYVLWKIVKLPATVLASTRQASWVRTERRVVQENA